MDLIVDSSWRRVLGVTPTAGPWLSDFLKDPELAISRGGPLKPCDTTTAVKLDPHGLQVVNKRYNIQNRSNRLSRCWRPRRAWRCWKAAKHLKELGIATPMPLAMGEERCAPLRSGA